MLDKNFLTHFKQKTEERWCTIEINRDIYGFQFQAGTRWNSGLSAGEIETYQDAVKIRFPNDLKMFFATMNGTDLPTVNIYGDSGTPAQKGVGVYSYPRDLEIVKMRIADVNNSRQEIRQMLAEQGCKVAYGFQLMPIYGHRYVLCTSDLASSSVLSIHGNDVIVYEDSLREYLTKEFLGNSH
jgi:hypothetical protein